MVLGVISPAFGLLRLLSGRSLAGFPPVAPVTEKSPAPRVVLLDGNIIRDLRMMLTGVATVPRWEVAAQVLIRAEATDGLSASTDAFTALHAVCD